MLIYVSHPTNLDALFLLVILIDTYAIDPQDQRLRFMLQLILLPVGIISKMS